MIDKNLHGVLVSSRPRVRAPSELSTFVLPPIFSPLSVMEPADTAQITPPSLSGALRGELEGFALWAWGLGAPPPQSEVWEAGGQPRRCSEPSAVPHRPHVRSDFTRCKMRVIPPSRADKWISGAQIALHLPTQLPRKACQRLIYATVKSDTSHRT